MNAIIIAAGSGKRISNDVKETPKSLILVNEKPIIEYQIELLKQKKIENIIVITGKYSEKFHLKDVHYVNDPNFEKHDILGSLMVAKQFLNGNVIVLYSDIIFEEKILQQMLDSKGNISIGVDMNWEKNYDGRTEHPKSEAENVLIENEVKVVQIKKSISSSNKNIGEFLGIIKFSKYGSELFVKKYDEIFHYICL